MRNVLIIGALVVAVVGSMFWGYKEHQEKEKIALQAENQYQRAYNELSYNIDLLHDKIGTTLAMNSRSSLSPALVEVWKIATESQADVGQLPLTLLPFHNTQQFLTNIGNFSYRTSVRDLEKNPLSDKEYAYLKKMYQRSDELEDQLRDVQDHILDNNLRWMDVQQALGTNESPKDNAIIDGFTKAENKAKSYVEDELGPTAMTTKQTQEDDFQYLTGENISSEEAKEIAASFVKNAKATKVINSLKGAKDQYYQVTLSEEKTKSEIAMDITKQGGHPIFFINSRDVKNQKISIDDAIKKAEAFLKEKKYEDMALYDSTQYDNVAVLTYVASKNGVRIYPDTVQLKVALDNGSILGFNARNYLLTHHKRTIPTATLSKEEAREKINKNVEIMEDRLSIISNDFNKEVLCYEFIGKLEKDTYEIFINAKDGTEEKVRKLQNIEKKYD